MVSVLLVEDDEPSRASVKAMLREMGVEELAEAHDISTALARLHQGGIDILLTELTLAGSDALELLRKLGRVSPRTVPIAMSSVASVRACQAALRLGAVDVLSKPFSREEAERALGLAIDSLEGFRGSIHGLSLVDLLQAFHLARRSIGIEVRGAKDSGLVLLSNGELVHAETGQLKGEVALMMLLAMGAGSLATVPYREVAPTIERDFQEVLLDGFRLMDEQQQPPPRESSHPESSPPSVLPVAQDDEAAELRAQIGHLDSELGAAVLGPQAKALLPGRFLPRQWKELAALGEKLLSQASPGWRRIEWVSQGIGLALLRSEEQGQVVLLAQRFVEKLDDRRFRWNTACVGRFLSGAGELS